MYVTECINFILDMILKENMNSPLEKDMTQKQENLIVYLSLHKSTYPNSQNYRNSLSQACKA